MTPSRGRRPEEDCFLSCRCLGGQWLLCDETERKDCCPFPQCVSCSSSTCANFVALQCCEMLWVNLSPSRKQCAAEKIILARLERFFTCPTTISRVRRSFVERRPRVIKDNSEEHDLACLGSSPIVIGKMFQHPLKALLDHA